MQYFVDKCDGIWRNSYLWNGGTAATSATNSFSSPGAYTVTITRANGCSAGQYQPLQIQFYPVRPLDWKFKDADQEQLIFLPQWGADETIWYAVQRVCLSMVDWQLVYHTQSVCHNHLLCAGRNKNTGCFHQTRTPVTAVVNTSRTLSTQSAIPRTICLNETADQFRLLPQARIDLPVGYVNTTASNVGGIKIGAASNSYTPLTEVAGTEFSGFIIALYRGSCAPPAVSAVSGQ